jgi:hypothetical protein
LALRRYATAVKATGPLKLAIVGAGPSGFYTASRILASLQDDNIEVHMYERLPTPYGLVRYGVAPDHPEVKVCLYSLLVFVSRSELPTQIRRARCRFSIPVLRQRFSRQPTITRLHLSSFPLTPIRIPSSALQHHPPYVRFKHFSLPRYTRLRRISPRERSSSS